MHKERPFWEKLYFDAAYYETARVIGYGGCLHRELHAKLEPLYQRFGKTKVESCVYHVAVFDGQLRTNVSPLAKVELRQLCHQLLGPSPERWEEFYRNCTAPPPNPYQKTPESKPEPKRRSRKKAG